MNWTPRTLKGQLTLLFLLLTLVPSLVLTTLATSRLLAALERWENPGVQRAGVARKSLKVRLRGESVRSTFRREYSRSDAFSQAGARKSQADL